MFVALLGPRDPMAFFHIGENTNRGLSPSSSQILRLPLLEGSWESHLMEEGSLITQKIIKNEWSTPAKAEGGILFGAVYEV